MPETETPRQKYRHLDTLLPSEDPKENLVLSRLALIQRNLDPACRDRLDFLQGWCQNQLTLKPVILAVEPALRCLAAGFKSHRHDLALLGSQGLLKIHAAHPASLFLLRLKSAEGILADSPQEFREAAKQCLEQIQKVGRNPASSLFELLYSGGDEVSCLRLLENPASAYEIEYEEDNCLELAIRRNFPALTTELIQLGYPLMLRGAMGRTPLHAAAVNGNTAQVQLLIAAGSPLNLLDLDGQSPAHLAILENRIQVLELLLKAGLDANLLNSELEPLSLLAARQKMDTTLKLLQDHGADFKIASPSCESAYSLGYS